MDNIKYVELGSRTYPVVPQPHARLRHHLSGSDFQKILSRDYATESYKLLKVLIPAISQGVRSLDSNGFVVEPFPEYEWEGFKDQESLDRYNAGDRDAYDDEAAELSPTGDQMAAAIEAALAVNGAGRVGKLLTLIQTAGTLATQETPTPSSPALPGTNGASHSTSSTTTAPTSTESAE